MYGSMQDNEDGGVGYVEHHGGESRGSGACATMCMGFILFPAALLLLGWNEKNTVCQENIMMEAEDNAEVGACGQSAAVEGKFTFYSCPIDKESMQMLTPATSFNTPGLQELIKIDSVAASQKMEMYQCIETSETVSTNKDNSRRRRTTGSALQTEAHEDDKEEEEDHAHEDSIVRSQGRRRKTSGSATVYRYRMGWSGTHYNSHEFKATPQNVASSGCPDFLYNGQVNHNPAIPDRGDGKPAELGRQLVHATNLVAGGYTLNDETELGKLTADEKVDLNPFASSFALSASTDNIITSINKNTVAVHAETPNYLSTCRTERLGCLRISYNKSDVTHVSVMGNVIGAGVVEPVPIESKWGCEATKFIRMYPEEMGKEEMIAKMRGENTAQTWAIRVGGLIMAWLTLYCCFEPISAGAEMAGDYLPSCLGDMLEGVVTMFLCVISCGFGMSCGLFVIAIVWCGMRPMVGGPLMAAVLVLFAIGYFASSKAERDPSKVKRKAMDQPYYEQPATQEGYAQPQAW